MTKKKPNYIVLCTQQDERELRESAKRAKKIKMTYKDWSEEMREYWLEDSCFPEKDENNIKNQINRILKQFKF